MALFTLSNAFAAPSIDEIVESAVVYNEKGVNGVDFFEYYVKSANWKLDELSEIFSITVKVFKLNDNDIDKLLEVIKNYLIELNAERDRGLEFSGPNTNTNLYKTPKGDPRPNPVPVTPDPISPQN